MGFIPRAGDLRYVLHDGRVLWRLQCPRCGVVGDLDDDQFHGRVSIQCPTPGCKFHETVDLSAYT